MKDRDIVTNYRRNVIAMGSIIDSIEWNQRHSIPVLTMPDQLTRHNQNLLRFEEVLNELSDPKAENILRCRYALGWSARKTAVFLGVHTDTINNITRESLSRMI